MKWVKASERLPDVMPDTSESFFVRTIDDKTKKVSFYGISGGSLLRRYPYNIEWLDESPSPSIEELAQKLRATNPYEEYYEYSSKVWNKCVDKLIELSKQQTNE